MHRVIILASYTVLGLTVIGLENQPGLIPGPVLAGMGITVTLSFLASPIMVFFSIKSLILEGRNKVTISYVLLSTVYLIVVTFGVYKIWPSLMGI